MKEIRQPETPPTRPGKSIDRLKRRVAQLGSVEALRRIEAFVDQSKDDWTAADWEDFYRVAEPIIDYVPPSKGKSTGQGIKRKGN